MTQKQIEGGWKTHRPRTADYERSALSGFDNFNRVAVNSSRARLITQIVNQAEECPQNEFASYYYGSKYNHTKYSVTSHAMNSPDRRKRTFISSYPSMVGLRWDPNKVKSVEHSRTDVTNDHTFKCKCENCRMKYCRSKKNPPLNTLKPFKDNIMTFCDKETMTPKLRDAFCGACSSSATPKMSDVSVTTSCTRDMEAESIDYNDCEPISILKKKNAYKCERCGYRKEKNADIIHQPERDVECDQEYMKPKSIRSLFKRRKEKPVEVEPPRKTLYNEGINDIVARRFPLTPSVIPQNINLNSASRISIPSMSISNKLNIPFSHKNQSRYHTTCKRSSNKFKCDDDVSKHLVASPEVIRRCSTGKAVRHSKLPNIKLPRRVLTSERDIESYVDKTPRRHG